MLIMDCYLCIRACFDAEFTRRDSTHELAVVDNLAYVVFVAKIISG